MKICKQCTQLFEPIDKRVVCHACRADELTKKALRNLGKQKREKQAKDKERIKTRPEWIKDAQVAFNAFIRARDKGKPCISCNKQIGNNEKHDAGHFYSSGGHSNLRFNENNCHSQCVHCNQHLSANLIPYAINLPNRIGKAAFDELHELAYIPKKWSIDECKEIIAIYKQKTKELNERN
jgi:hypothetical protein